MWFFYYGRIEVLEDLDRCADFRGLRGLCRLDENYHLKIIATLGGVACFYNRSRCLLLWGVICSNEKEIVLLQPSFGAW